MFSNQSPCFAEDQIFITGASGFLGSVLVWKLLHTRCRQLLLLVRGGEARFRRIAETTIPPEQLRTYFQQKRLRVFDGDIEKSNLGLTKGQLSEITNHATIFIHAASTINLKLPLASVRKLIIEPSLKIARIALAAPNLRKFVYVSTAYANAHLHALHTGTETPVAERIYPLRPGKQDSTAMEYQDLQQSSNSPEYHFHNFPFAYAYAKHLTERLLQRRFAEQNRSRSLLILRPSIIGPALHEPFSNYETPGSAPATSFLAAIMTTFSLHVDFASRFEDPDRDSTFDEIPVDLVVNQLLMHVVHDTSDIVHAVAGARARWSTGDVWRAAMAERRLPWQPRLIWHKNRDWKDERLHPVARALVVIGTSYCFESARTDALWEQMSVNEKDTWPLLAPPPQCHVEAVRRKAGIHAKVMRFVRKKKWPEILVDVLVHRSDAATSRTSDCAQRKGGFAQEFSTLWSKAYLPEVISQGVGAIDVYPLRSLLVLRPFWTFVKAKLA